jgi:hypothetical protein
MSDEKKHTVDEKIEVLMVGNDTQASTVEYKEFLDKIDELYKQNIQRSFSKYCISLVKDKELGWGLLFTGTRDETKEETSKREMTEAMKKKQIEDAELKEFLRLKKKYGKKEE